MSTSATILRALADETRMQMLALIRRHGELCVCDLEHVLEITQSKSSRHLRYLLNAGLLQDRREAIWIYYRVSENLSAAQAALLDCVEKLMDHDKMRDLNLKLQEWREQKQCGVVRDKLSGTIVKLETTR
jgi:ArsR family transcriptional regulator, arsenate/arsenite/antimonite-responsive transcriptional repressor